MCVTDPLLLADLNVAIQQSYIKPTFSPQQGLLSVVPAPALSLAGSRLPDYGLCAFDAGLTSSLRESLERGATDADRLELRPASWYTLSDLSGQPTLVAPGLSYQPSADGGGVLTVDQVGLAGNFGLADETWQVLPRRYRRGYSVEMAFYLPAAALTDLAAQTAAVPFFYWGTRAANKFWQVAQPLEAPYLLHTGVPLEEVNPSDPLDGLQLHAQGLFAQPDGALVIRWLDESANLRQLSTLRGTLTSGWQHLVLSWCPEQRYPDDPEVADCWPFRRGTLRLISNGTQVLAASQVPELRHRELPGPASQQYTVPFYLSWGSGAPGLTHAYVPADAAGTPLAYAGEPTVIEQAFGGCLRGMGLRRLRVYEGAVTPLQARALRNDYQPALTWGQADALLEAAALPAPLGGN